MQVNGPHTRAAPGAGLVELLDPRPTGWTGLLCGLEPGHTWHHCRALQSRAPAAGRGSRTVLEHRRAGSTVLANGPGPAGPRPAGPGPGNQRVRTQCRGLDSESIAVSWTRRNLTRQSRPHLSVVRSDRTRGTAGLATTAAAVPPPSNPSPRQPHKPAGTRPSKGIPNTHAYSRTGAHAHAHACTCERARARTHTRARAHRHRHTGLCCSLRSPARVRHSAQSRGAVEPSSRRTRGRRAVHMRVAQPPPPPLSL